MTKKVPRAKKRKKTARKTPAKAPAKAKGKVLAYDLGGTKVAAGVVDAQGNVLEEIRVPVQLENGKAGLFKQLGDLGLELIHRHPGIRRVGIASAGPLDPQTGFLLDPTNFTTHGQTWGKVPIAQVLAKKLGRPVVLENDAAAAMLAERWMGAARGFDNAMILTLGTGLGTGIICNGKLLRSGRMLHPEAGHMIVNSDDASAPCGCGNIGCAEAYLSGRNFGRRAAAKIGNPDLSALDIANLARKHDPLALAAFDEYSDIMAVTLHNYVVTFSPEIIVFTGSFAGAADLFLRQTKGKLEKLLLRRRVGIDLMPLLKVSTLDNEAGILGGAFVAHNATS